MTLQQRIESAMREAMRARDVRRTGTLRMAMAAPTTGGSSWAAT